MTFEEASAFKMPFGKHKGEALDSIPLRYLDWVAGLGDLYPNTQEAIDTYLNDPAIRKAWMEEFDE